MKFAVEAWAPDYGSPMGGGDAGDPTARVDTDVEVTAEAWAPITPDPQPAGTIAFVDGVTRIDAQVWITGDDGVAKPGVCATYAAGAVHCAERATVGDVRVGRTLFTPSPAAAAIGTRHHVYEVTHTAGDMAELSAAPIERMRKLEAEVARDVAGADLIVLDGLLWGRADVPNAVGYVKTHRAPYLDGVPLAAVEALTPGQRTPFFLISSTWDRFSWYVRLPGADGHPWAGIVRCEASPDLSPADVRALADRTAASLPRFASSAHKDPRAPQNLYPIAGLERELRRRSGDPQLVYRALRAAAARA